jgi:hypothetical protein
MNKAGISALVAAPLAIGAAAYFASVNNIFHPDYAFASDALVLIPVANQEYADAAASLYLEPNGFEGTATNFIIPETSGLIRSVELGVHELVQAVETQWQAGDFSAADPLYIFGYSQGAVVASLAEQQLADDGIPENALHFVMVGDSASAEGGWLNTFVDSLPEGLRQFATDTLKLLGASPILGLQTPDDLYPTDVYTLSGDGWASWDNGTNIPGMFIDHLAYLGLTPDEIGSATEFTDGLTNYYTIDSVDVDMTSALWNTTELASFL